MNTATAITIAALAALTPTVTCLIGIILSRQDNRDTRAELRGEIAGVRGEINGVRGEITGVRGEITDVRGEILALRTVLRDDYQARRAYGRNIEAITRI